MIRLNFLMACTVAYPYMNGKLHLGHLMTIVNNDIAVRYRRAKGEKVVFPFGFHCTGMPIYASAMKLRAGDEATVKSLQAMGFIPEEIHNFEDPHFWLKVFPELAFQDLQDLNLDIDFSRSFVTTDLNPYYDSFVQWQYRKLDELGYLSYEDRLCIYSERDCQPCADHDRQTGEGVKPKPYTIKGGVPVDVDGNRGPGDAEFWNRNAKAQGVELVVGAMVWLPSETVISRSGDQCIVTKVPQWYIKYSNPEWKAQALKVLDGMTIHNEEVRNQLEIAVQNLDDWCVSREYGLGTKLPNDPKFLIDSLSDSTRYMAYYTVCHLLHSDLYGQQGLVPIENVNDQFWNAVFYGTEYKGPIDISPFREQFKTYYPPKLRVSGKDLIYNHLVMSIYQHIAIFGEDMCCQEYLVNGHAKINGTKMSKSTGNFVTIADAKKQYRIDALRVLLVEGASPGTVDCNIRLTEYQNVVRALDDTHDPVPVPVQHEESQPKGDQDIVNILMDYYQQAQRGFETGRFRDSLTYGWRKCQKLLTTYLHADNPDQVVINLARTIQHVTLCPVVGQPIVHRMPSWTKNYKVDHDIIKIYDYLVLIHKQITKAKGVPSHITIPRKLEQWTEYIQSKTDLQVMYDDTVLHSKRDPYKIKPVVD